MLTLWLWVAAVQGVTGSVSGSPRVVADAKSGEAKSGEAKSGEAKSGEAKSAGLAQSSADGGQAPTPREMAQLFFLAGDLKRAVDAGRRCLQLEGKKRCEPLYRALVEYEALIPKNQQLSAAEAKAYLQFDRQISPQRPGKLTLSVLQRHVLEPLEAGQLALGRGDADAAAQVAGRVLEIDPQNADAKKLLADAKALRK